MELRKAFAEAGYRVYPWKQGINKGAFKDILHGIEAQLDEIYNVHKVPVLLVGWSLGGLFAREVARGRPEKTLAVVTLGSPIAEDLRFNHVWKTYEWITGHQVNRAPVQRITEKPPVPSLAIWSCNDGLIPPRAARGTEAERDKEVMLECTHMGFGIGHYATRQVVKATQEFLESYV
jgi:pimeloyl-ACP methyl ester carboxylesterase